MAGSSRVTGGGGILGLIFSDQAWRSFPGLSLSLQLSHLVA